jgi:hypothetical protein
MGRIPASEKVALHCADGMMVTTTLREWNAFVDAKIKIFDAGLLRTQTRQIIEWRRRSKKQKGES